MKLLKVLPDPRFIGGHPYHQNRFIVTEDCVLVVQPSSVGDSWVADTGKVVSSMMDTDEQAQYARLFAAAPDLFAVLEQILNCCELNTDDLTDNAKNLCLDARAAINKAKGI